MPLVDMPLHELKQYQGINPRPADFDAFWDASLQEMHALGTECTLTPASFSAPNAECLDLYFTGVNGARVYAKFLKPLGKGPFPAVCMFHGYTGSSGDWSDKLTYVNAGFVVAALDCRGQGGCSEDVGGVRGNTHRGHIIRGLEYDAPDKLLFRDIFLDTAQLARIVMAMECVDEKRVCANGGSQGGALTLACASLEPNIARAASLFPFLCDYKRVWEMDLAKDAYEEIRTWFRQFDPTHAKEDAVFEKLGYIDVQFLTPRIKGEILMLTGLMDTICPPSTQFAAYNKITAKKDLIIFPDFGHEWAPGMNDAMYSFIMEV